MQKYWPAHEAVAKLRHEAAISEMKEVQSQMQMILERLEMERSSASFAPIWGPAGEDGHLASLRSSYVRLRTTQCPRPRPYSYMGLFLNVSMARFRL